MSAVPPIPEEDELLAAELAFGLLDMPERADAERRLAGDPDFAAAHRRWQDRAVGLFVEADVAPPEGMWAAIVARLPANDGVGRTDGRLRNWQWASAAAAVLAIASTTALLLRPATTAAPVSSAAPPVVRRTLIAIVASPERPASVAIGYDPDSRRLTVLPSRVSADGHATELWVIPGDGTPRSLGVVAAGGPSERIAPARVAGLIAPGATLAVSVEPAGGSPTGKPTGPVILTGAVRVG